MAKKLTVDFSGKTPAQTASIMKAEADGVKRNAELRIWPQLEKAKEAEDKITFAYWMEVIEHLCLGTEDPKVETVEPYKAASLSDADIRDVPELSIVE